MLRNPAARLAFVLAVLATLIIVLIVSGAATLAGFSGPCRTMDKLQNEYSFAPPRGSTASTFEGVFMFGEEPRVFQPDAMSDFTRRNYEKAKMRCEEM